MKQTKTMTPTVPVRERTNPRTSGLRTELMKAITSLIQSPEKGHVRTVSFSGSHSIVGAVIQPLLPIPTDHVRQVFMVTMRIVNRIWDEAAQKFKTATHFCRIDLPVHVHPKQRFAF